MFRIGIACALLLAASGGVIAETPAERGFYLVNTIMACGNCHTPRDAEGKSIAGQAFSGGLTFTTPAFIAKAPNITPDVETGIGSWSDAEIKRALIEGVRPDHGRLAGVPLAAIMPANFYKALLPADLDAIVAYLHTVKPIRNEAPNPVYKAPVRRDAYPDADAGFDRAMFGAAPIWSPSVTAWNATPHGRAACRISKPASAAADGFSRRARDLWQARRTASPPTSPRTRPPASAPGTMPKSSAPSVRGLRVTVIRSSSRWPTAFMPG
jgi:mono/diheme cytochrome c family protein